MLVDDDHAGGIAPVAVDPELPCKARWAAAAMEVMSTPQSTWSTPLVKSHSHVFRGIRSVVPVSPAVGTGGGLAGSDQLIKTAMDALLRQMTAGSFLSLRSTPALLNLVGDTGYPTW